MKKITLIISMLLVYAFGGYADTWDGSSKKWSDGSGSSSDPYLIASAANLAYLSAMVEAGYSYEGIYFKQTVDIDLNNLTWTSIGTSSTHFFAGIYDGNNHSIKKLSTNKNGLFGYTKNVTIKNLIVNGNVQTDIKGAGIIVGYNEGNLTISNCKSSGKVSLSSLYLYYGGIVGYVRGGNVNISDCINSATVKGKDIGGIVGHCEKVDNDATLSVTILNCSNSGVISTDNGGIAGHAGGIIGYSETKVTIKNCSNTATITGNFTGGISGTKSKVINSYNTGNIVCTYEGAGIAPTNSSAEQCYNSGNISQKSGMDYNSSAYGTKRYYVGIAENATYCYNTGNITTNSSKYDRSCGVGIYAENCYNVGTLKGNAKLKYGVCGPAASTNLYNSYYLSTCGAVTPSDGCVYGEPKTQAYMQSEALVVVLNAESKVLKM